MEEVTHACLLALGYEPADWDVVTLKNSSYRRLAGCTVESNLSSELSLVIKSALSTKMAK